MARSPTSASTRSARPAMAPFCRASPSVMACRSRAMPSERSRPNPCPALAMGCGVFLQSDIVNQQRKGWSAEEIMASLAAVLPLNVWVYACQLQNSARGRAQVRAAGWHAPQSCSGQGSGRFHHQQDSRRGDRDPPLYRRSRRDRRGALRLGCMAQREAQSFPRFRRHRSAVLSQHDQRGHDLSVVQLQLQAHLHRCAAARSEGKAMEQGSASRRGGNASSAAIPARKVWSRTSTKCGSVKARLEEAKRAYPNVGEMVRAEAFRQLKTPI